MQRNSIFQKQRQKNLSERFFAPEHWSQTTASLSVPETRSSINRYTYISVHYGTSLTLSTHRFKDHMKLETVLCDEKFLNINVDYEKLDS